MDVGVDAFIFLISRQICVDLISASIYSTVVPSEELPFGFLLAKTTFFSVSFSWKEEGTRILGGLSLFDGDFFHRWHVYVLK